MEAKCLKVEYRKPNLVLTVEIYGKEVEIKIGEKFKTNFQFLADYIANLTPKVQRVIKETMPEQVEIIIGPDGEYEIDMLKNLPWATATLEKLKRI